MRVIGLLPRSDCKVRPAVCARDNGRQHDDTSKVPVRLDIVIPLHVIRPAKDDLVSGDEHANPRDSVVVNGVQLLRVSRHTRLRDLRLLGQHFLALCFHPSSNFVSVLAFPPRAGVGGVHLRSQSSLFSLNRNFVVAQGACGVFSSCYVCGISCMRRFR